MNEKSVYYSGIGCKDGYKHTVQEFIEIMKNEFQHKSWENELKMFDKSDILELNFNDWILPDDFCFFTLEDWIEYSGAIMIDCCDR